MSTVATTALREHLRSHLADGFWHDACPWCLRRRTAGGNGVSADDLNALLDTADEIRRLRERLAEIHQRLEHYANNARTDGDRERAYAYGESASQILSLLRPDGES